MLLEGNTLYEMFISTLLVQSSKTVVILCCIKLEMTIFMAFTSSCGIMIGV